MTIWRMRIACWITKALDTHSEYVVLIAFPLQLWFHELASMLRFTLIVSHAPSNQRKTVGYRVTGHVKTLPQSS